MKMKKMLTVLLAAVMVTVSVPMVAGATESDDYESQVVTDDQEQGVFQTPDPESTITDAPYTEGPSTEVAPGTDLEDIKEEEPEVIEGENIDTDNVVTLGENLTEEQRASMYEYFGTSADSVRTIIVTHEQEVAHMQGIATAEQIGNSTNSCAYVEPTQSGGIKVKTANLTYVTSAMIASTLTTAGIENANVVAACPFPVSGTGALTGIIMAYETASGDKLDSGMKDAAMAELIATGNLAEVIGSEEASDVINEVKTKIIDQDLEDPEEIGAVVDEIAEEHGVTLDEGQREEVVELMETISKYDYDLGTIQKTLENLDGKVSAIQEAWTTFKSFFVGSDDGILSQTNDEILGGDVQVTSTVGEGGFKEGLIQRIMNLFKK